MAYTKVGAIWYRERMARLFRQQPAYEAVRSLDGLGVNGGGGSAVSPFAILTESGIPITTESGIYIEVEHV